MRNGAARQAGAAGIFVTLLCGLCFLTACRDGDGSAITAPQKSSRIIEPEPGDDDVQLSETCDADASLACGRLDISMGEPINDRRYWETFAETWFNGGRSGPVWVTGWSEIARGLSGPGYNEHKGISCYRGSSTSCEDFVEHEATCNWETNDVRASTTHAVNWLGRNYSKIVDRTGHCDKTVPNQESAQGGSPPPQDGQPHDPTPTSWWTGDSWVFYPQVTSPANWIMCEKIRYNWRYSDGSLSEPWYRWQCDDGSAYDA